MTYLQEVKAARERYQAAVEEAEETAGEEALRISENHDTPLQTVCKDIAGARWQAVREQARRLEAGSKPRRRRAVQLSEVRSLLKKEPETVARELAKVAPDMMIEVAAEQAGQTRRAAPSNQAKVEQAFGPTEFNRLEDAEDAVIERLPDLAPNKDDQAYAEELATKTDGVADMLRGWARGEDVGKEAEEWLQAR